MAERSLIKKSRIYVAGHTGMVGSAILRKLKSDAYKNLITRAHGELDLTCQGSAEAFMEAEKPDCVVLAAAKVGGILANDTLPAEFIRDNLAIQTNVIHGAYVAGIKSLLFLGSSCIYPRNAPQPMAEEHLLAGSLEPTNEPYAVAKIAGLKLCESYNRQYGTNYRAVMPTNLYGPGDNFDLESSHVVPALIRKFHDAMTKKENAVTLWGTGEPLREFLHVDDLAAACVFVMQQPDTVWDEFTHPQQCFLNVGTGKDMMVRELAELIKGIVGFDGEVLWDTSKPDGTPRKLLDTHRINAMGWKPTIELEHGLATTYDWYVKHAA